jgi:hypothetical protein
MVLREEPPDIFLNHCSLGRHGFDSSEDPEQKEFAGDRHRERTSGSVRGARCLRRTKMNADEEIDKAMEQVVEDIKTLRKTIAEARASGDQVGFRNFLCGILNCALTDYRTVEIGVKKLVELAAWGRRNLIELRVTTEYALQCEENFVSLQHDLLRDMKEFYEAISLNTKTKHKQWLEMLANTDFGDPQINQKIEEVRQRELKLGPQTGISDSEAKGIKDTILNLGLKDGRPKMAGDLAKAIKQQADFKPENGILSKMVHRTMLSIASSNERDGLAEIVPSLMSGASNDLLAIFGRIKEYVETAGITIPPKRPPATTQAP